MNIDFKEKTFEKYFGHELARLTNITYSPDQCDEALLGFDEAFFMPEEFLFRVAPYVRRRRKGRLTGFSVDNFNKLGKIAAQHMPKFKFNLFVQFKRPVFLTTRGANQWIDWKQPYYRYETTQHQQEALERIDQQSNGRAATVYASPAFRTVSDLWVHVENEAVADHSNIASVGKLKGHEHYSYIEPGFLGKGHSETVDIESEPLLQLIRSSLERNEPLPLNQHLKKTAVAVIEAIDSSDNAALYFRRVQRVFGIEEFDPNSLYDAITIIEAFSDAFEVRFYAVG